MGIVKLTEADLMLIYDVISILLNKGPPTPCGWHLFLLVIFWTSFCTLKYIPPFVPQYNFFFFLSNVFIPNLFITLEYQWWINCTFFQFYSLSLLINCKKIDWETINNKSILVIFYIFYFNQYIYLLTFLICVQ